MNRLLSVCLLTGLLGFSHLAKAEITVTIDRKPVHVNESFQLFFEADQKPDRNPDFSPLQKDFVLFNSSQSNSISIINGDYRRSIKWTLQLMPKRVGEVIVPAIHFGKDRSNAFKVDVKPASQNTALAGEGLIFELSSDKASIPVQGQIVVRLRLLTNLNISAYQMGDLDIDGVEVVVEPLGRARQYRTQLGDTPYLVREKKFALFPQQTGELKIKPVLAEVQLGVRAQSLFDPFPESNNIRRVRSQGLTLEVTSIADSYAAPHWLPATSVRLADHWQGDLSRVVAGEPVTRTISLVAEGLTAAQLPDLAVQDIAGVKQYPDKPLLQDQRTTEGIIGTREQKIALIPTAAGSYTLPEIAIPWWNVNTHRQEVARIPSRTLNVHPAAENGIVSRQNLDPVPVNPVGQATPASSGTETNRFWIWLSLFLALGWMVSILAWWIVRRRPTRPGPTPPAIAVVSLRKAKRRLKQTCVGNNAPETRDALLNWAKCIDPDQQFSRLSQIARYFGEPLKGHIDALNLSLYSQGGTDWDGETLWQACASYARRPKDYAGKEEGNRLQPLIP
ncbi:MAG: BatD family protein [Gammaproteobacteria bacterium]